MPCRPPLSIIHSTAVTELFFFRSFKRRKVWERVRALEAAARDGLHRQGFRPEDVSSQAYLNLRFQGTDTALMTPASAPQSAAAQIPEPGGVRGAVLAGEGGALDAFFEQYR